MKYKIVVRPRYNIFDALVAYNVSLILDGYTVKSWYYDAILSRSIGKWRACNKAEHLANKYNCDYYSFNNNIISI